MNKFTSSVATAVVLAGTALLAACGSVRMQSPQQATQELAKGAQGHARNACEQHRDSSQYFECRKRVEQTYDAWREERAAKDSGKGS